MWKNKNVVSSTVQFPGELIISAFSYSQFFPVLFEFTFFFARGDKDKAQINAPSPLPIETIFNFKDSKYRLKNCNHYSLKIFRSQFKITTECLERHFNEINLSVSFFAFYWDLIAIFTTIGKVNHEIKRNKTLAEKVYCCVIFQEWICHYGGHVMKSSGSNKKTDMSNDRDSIHEHNFRGTFNSEFST